MANDVVTWTTANDLAADVTGARYYGQAPFQLRFTLHESEPNVWRLYVAHRTALGFEDFANEADGSPFATRRDATAAAERIYWKRYWARKRRT
jgi:hypothetical protein